MPSLSRFMQLLTGTLSAAACGWMAWMLCRTWLTPMAVENGRWVSLGVGIMVMEFILVHSGGMISAVGLAEKSPRLLLPALGLLYALFGLAIAFAFDSRLLLVSFVSIMIPRFINAVSGSQAARLQNLQRSVVSALLYLGVAFLSVMIPFPEGGLSIAVLDQVYPDRGGGLWEEEPQRALAAGMIYFIGLGLNELAALLRAPPRPADPLLSADPL